MVNTYCETKVYNYNMKTEEDIAKPTTFYVIHRLDDDAALAGMVVASGFYKYKYALDGGIEIDSPCEFSKDRVRWEKCNLFGSLGEFQEFFGKFDTMKIEREEYVETITWRDVSVPVFLDDYGQCFYCIYNGRVLSFGSFQDGYEDEIRELIDSEYEKAKR